MTADIHTCSYYCERPECVRRQRDELRDRLEALTSAPQPAAPSVAAASAEPVLWYRTLFGAETKPDGRCYDVVFCDPHDSRYTPLYAAPQQTAAVDEAMARMANKARQLQRKFYGDACGLHLEMIDWAREFDALAAQQRGGHADG